MKWNFQSWKRFLWIGTVALRIFLFLLRLFSDPDVWLWAMGILVSVGFINLNEAQQSQITKVGTSICSFILHLWSNT
jgi:hypothetical protein